MRDFVQFGLLYNAGLVDEPNLYFCPANNTFNPKTWEPGRDKYKYTYAGYGARPSVHWSYPAHGFPHLPTSDEVANVAILADLLTPKKLLDTHGTGVSVLYGNGGASYVRADAFDENLSHVDNNPWSTLSNNWLYLKPATGPLTGVWADLDQNP